MTTQNAACDALQAFLTQVDADQAVIDPAHVPMTAVIRAWQNGPRPLGAYAMVQILGARDLNEAECYDYTEAAYPGAGRPRFIETLRRVRAILFDIEVFASDALDRAEVFEAALISSARSVTILPWTAYLTKPARHDPALIQQRWEGRAIFTIEMRGVTETKSFVDTIDLVPIAIEGQVVTEPITSASLTVARP